MAVSAGASGGCGLPYCDDGIALRKTYLVTVIEPYDEVSQFAQEPSLPKPLAGKCGSGFDLLGGVAFNVDVKDSIDSATCKTRVIVPRMVPGVDIGVEVRPPDSAARGLMTSAHYRVVIGGKCQGTDWSLTFVVLDRERGPLAEPVAGQVPPVVMERDLAGVTDVASCLRPRSTLGTPTVGCHEYFVVKIQEDR
jgi:hypothetical protein